MIESKESTKDFTWKKGDKSPFWIWGYLPFRTGLETDKAICLLKLSIWLPKSAIIGFEELKQLAYENKYEKGKIYIKGWLVREQREMAKSPKATRKMTSFQVQQNAKVFLNYLNKNPKKQKKNKIPPPPTSLG